MGHLSLAKKRNLFVFMFSASLFSSCVSHEQLLDFRKIDEFQPLVPHDIENLVRIHIQPDDVLFIQVHSMDPLSAAPFNIVPTTGQTNVTAQNATLQGYLVDPGGYIDFPVLGKLKLAGLTTDEANGVIIQRLKPYLEAPVVSIRFLNFRVTVLGEVNGPSTFPIQGEKVTILEALGMAGDFTPYSNRDRVLVIREQNGKRDFGYLDLRSPDLFQSPYFYLQQNDVVYVEPIKAKTATVRDPIFEALPFVSTFLSIVTILVVIF